MLLPAVCATAGAQLPGYLLGLATQRIGYSLGYSYYSFAYSRIASQRSKMDLYQYRLTNMIPIN